MLLKKGMKDNLEYRVYDSREKMGEAAGNDIADAILEMLKEKDELNMIFAAKTLGDSLLYHALTGGN